MTQKHMPDQRAAAESPGRLGLRTYWRSFVGPIGELCVQDYHIPRRVHLTERRRVIPMREGAAPVEVLKTLPITPESSEELAEVANTLNEILVEHNLWADLIHSTSQRIYFVLLKTN